MAKVKVHELAKELDMHSKDILTFLKEKGVDAKAAQSTIEEEAVTMVKKHFSGNKENATSEVRPETKKEAGMAITERVENGAKTMTENTVSENRTEASEGSQAETAVADAAKKKKKIIIVSNSANSKISGNQHSYQNNNQNSYQNNNQNSNGGGARRSTNNYSGGSGQNRNNGNGRTVTTSSVYRPLIKPSVKPTPVKADSPYFTQSRNQNGNNGNTQQNQDVKKPDLNETVKTTAESIQPTEKPVDTNEAVKETAQTSHVTEQRPDTNRTAPQDNRNTYSSRPSGDGRPSYGNRPTGDGSRPSYGNRPAGDTRPSYGNRPAGDSRPPYGNRPAGDTRPSYGNRPAGDSRPPYGSRPAGDSRPPYGNRPAGDSRPPYGNRPAGDSRPPYGNRPAGDSRPPYNNGNTNRGYSSGYNNGSNNGTGTGYRPARPNDNFNRNGSDRGNGTQSGYGQRPYQNRSNGQQTDGANRAPYQNGQRSANGAPGSNRPYNNTNRSTRPDGKPDNRFRKPGQSGFTPEVQGKETDKRREEEKRRLTQAKDKKSRKDIIFEEDENAAPKKNRAGRFIKPEKKPEDLIEEQIKVITLPEKITIKELAEKMKMQPSAIIKKLFLKGETATVNSELTYEDAENIAIEYEIMCEKEIPIDVIEELLKEDDEIEENMAKRSPVVCVMGHVDHGKTSLLDAIRKTNVTGKEAGGITQAIGAYTVKVKNERITFLDTPGHEAFTAMRMRGADATDIAILVIAADDGVKPQTIEAIHHAKAAHVEIIVAVNKIDKPGANVEKVKQELMEYELVPTEWGGTTEFVSVSAKTREGLDTLLETILLTAEIMELKADRSRKARGLVIEAQLDKGRGPVATILVQKGTLSVGDFISAGASYGKVRAMIDDKGRHTKEAGPSTPVEILGLSDVPEAGEVFIAHENDKTARAFAETYRSQHKEKMIADTKAKMSLDDLFSQIKEGDLKELDLIIKADVQGSVEALTQSLIKLSNDEIIVKCIHGGVGTITESDVTLASASNAIIIGFNVKPDVQAKMTAERENVDVHLYDVIYQAIDDVERHIKGMEAPVYEEKITGHAEVRQIFKASALGNIAGAYVLDGIFRKNSKIRISREGKQIFEGKLASLKRFKDDVKEVKEGFECGFVFEDFDQIQELDIVEAFEMVEVPR